MYLLSDFTNYFPVLAVRAFLDDFSTINFFSASEDGTIMETDIRAPPEEVGILINLAADAGSGNCDTYIIHEFFS